LPSFVRIRKTVDIDFLNDVERKQPFSPPSEGRQHT